MDQEEMDYEEGILCLLNERFPIDYSYRPSKITKDLNQTLDVEGDES